VALLLVTGILASAGAHPATAPAPSGAPTLLVVLVVDQMRADYIDRYGHQWQAGLRRLLDHGAWFRAAAFPYLNTVTCPGHATIATGTYPHTHGVPLNEWWDHTAGRLVACTEDRSAPLVSYGRPVAGGESIAALRVPTLADELRLQLPTPPRIVTVSLKARTAIMLAGRRADAVTWFDDEGVWVTSTAYAQGPVPFVQQFIAANPVERELEAVWTPALEPGRYLFQDAGAGERPPAGWTATFPHPLRGDGSAAAAAAAYERWERSPWSDDYLGRLAEAGIDALSLGRGPGVDFLAVSFSALDRVGHRFGPHSHEVQDTLVRLDRTIGRLLDHLDRAVGRDRYVVALTADHGVAPIAERTQAAGIAAGRISGGRLADTVNRALEPYFGPGKYVARSVYTDLYLAPGVADRLAANPEALSAVVRALAGFEGLARVYRKEELAGAAHSLDPMKRAAALSYVDGRSGDLIVVPQPYFYFSSPDATTHGTAYQYDARVPIIFAGPGIRPGEYLTSASPADVAPTLAFVAGVTMAAAEGRVLAEAIEPAVAAKPR
jgi:predicted AlkP superfamily pyrophosphatase or phosphodiesterase